MGVYFLTAMDDGGRSVRSRSSATSATTHEAHAGVRARPDHAARADRRPPATASTRSSTPRRRAAEADARRTGGSSRRSAASSSTTSWPTGMPFYNCTLGKKGCSRVIDDTYAVLGRAGDDRPARRHEGDRASSRPRCPGLSIGITDLRIPAQQADAASTRRRRRSTASRRHYDAGAITERERHNQLLDLWAHCREQITEAARRDAQARPPRPGERHARCPSTPTEGMPYLNPVFLMSDSGARGNVSQMQQLAGMRGLMAKPSGEIIETPIRANFREGLNVLEYFSSTHGARKGLADTALKTADSGYLTRKLADVAQSVVVIEHDCGTKRGIPKRAIYKGEEVDVPLREVIIGRTARHNIVNPITDEVDRRGERAHHARDRRRKIEELGIDSVQVRSPLTCETAARRLRPVLRHGHVHRPARRGRPGGRHHRRPVDRRAGHAAHHADVPHRRRRRPRPRRDRATRPSHAGIVELRDCNEVEVELDGDDRPHGPQAQRRDRGARRQGPRAREVQGALRRR